jgi:hypothetical protein
MPLITERPAASEMAKLTSPSELMVTRAEPGATASNVSSAPPFVGAVPVPFCHVHFVHETVERSSQSDSSQRKRYRTPLLRTIPIYILYIVKTSFVLLTALPLVPSSGGASTAGRRRARQLAPYPVPFAGQYDLPLKSHRVEVVASSLP